MARQNVIVETAGLTTNQAPFIEQARRNGRLYIQQPYNLYSAENHEAWRRLFARMAPRWERYANEHFLAGIHSLCLDPTRVPKLEDVNRFLQPLTGFQAKAVSGYIPAFLFFDCLRNRTFPTTITIRPPDRLDYLPEPDIFHDVAGHVPMHTDRAFAETLVRFGECAHTAADLVAGIRDEREQVRRLTSIIRAMARFFWFTVEFGLMRVERRPARLWQRIAQLVRRDRTRHRFARSAALSRSNSNGPSTSRLRSTTTSRCCSSWIPSITCSIWCISWSAGCAKASWITWPPANPQ